jgi:hypothetical protein
MDTVGEFPHDQYSAASAFGEVFGRGGVREIFIVKPSAFITYADRQAVALFSHVDHDLFGGILSVSVYNSIGNRFGQADKDIGVQISADSVSRHYIIHVGAHFGYVFKV